jgi:uncharacterized protein (DUF2235 family)
MKNIVICCDGTWNSYTTQYPSNVVRVAEAAGVDSSRQPVYYDSGIGTSGTRLQRLIDGATGRGLSRNILEAYRRLIDWFEEDDRIFLFGYSRGAYTVRSLAGLIRKCGILRRENAALANQAYALYRDASRDPCSQAAKSFRDSNAMTTNAYFVGAFDTVGTLGIPLALLAGFNRRKFRFHDLSLSRRIKYGYHAVAVDEHRLHFKPALWQNRPAPGQTIEQAWFPGAHGNIGGGVQDTRLSHITLHWMLTKAARAGLLLTDNALDLHGDPRGTLYSSRHGIYALYPKHDRHIGTTPTESVHESVYERINSCPDYNPCNIVPRI